MAKAKAKTKKAVTSMTAREAQALRAALRDLSENRLPIAMAVRVGRITDEVAAYTDRLEERLRELFKECAGGRAAVQNGSPEMMTFNRKAEPLLDEVYEIPLPDPISISDFGADVVVSPQSVRTMTGAGVLEA